MAEAIEDTPIHLRGNGRPISEERTLTELRGNRNHSRRA